MTANFAFGSFINPGIGSDTNSVTGIGFTPKAIIIFSSGTLSNYAQSYRFSYGFGTSTAQAVIGNMTVHNAGSSITSCYKSTSYILSLIKLNNVDILLYSASLQSIDSDGFTLLWDLNLFTTITCYYIALGGSDVSAYVGSRDTPVSTGSESITGIGFQPTGLITAYNIIGSGDTTVNSYARYMIGFCGSDLTQHTITGDSKDAVRPAGFGGHYNNRNFEARESTTIYARGNVTMFVSDGWVENWTVLGSSAEYIYLAIGGININVGTFDIPVTPNTGNQSITGIIFKPIGTHFLTANQDTTRAGLYDVNMRTTIGGAQNSSNRGTIWSGDRGNITTSRASRSSHSTRCVATVTEGTPVVTENSVTDFVSNDSNGFTVNNTIVDATSRKMLFMSFSPNRPPYTWIKGAKILGAKIL